jgi:hypothetical protein
MFSPIVLIQGVNSARWLAEAAGPYGPTVYQKRRRWRA